MSSSGHSTAAVMGPKVCFNASCKEVRAEGPARRKGWRLRSGDVAELCDRCSTLYEQGSFCETFHADADGWRKCESCGKRVHCGCIASVSSFTLLDAGGIQCMPCAQKHFIAVPNQMWSSSSLLFPFQSTERLKELPGKNWNQLTSTSPVPGQWRPAPNAWSAAVAAQSELQQRLSYEFGPPSGIEKLFSTSRLALSEKKKVEDISERTVPNSVNRAAVDRIVNGNSTLKPSGYATFHRDEGGTDGTQNSPHLVGDHETIPTRKLVIQGSRLSSSTGIKLEAVASPCSNISGGPTLMKDEPTSVIGVASPFSSSVEANDPNRASVSSNHRQASVASFGKQLCRNTSNLLDSSGESQNLVRNGRPRMERGRSQLLPRYWPRITDQELQQISGDSNSVITPLFEKMLSASDAGRIGRLVLPKKCAEAYFPAISQPEGLPLKVQDATGKEWVFQFRFWPNNNSRMYVLEGVTPCIQSMQLQAGDTVTFSRIDPEGKLVMGFRKASGTQNEQIPNGSSPSSDLNTRVKQHDTSSVPLRPLKGNSELISSSNSLDHAIWPKFDKEGFIQKDGNGNATKSMTTPSKRKNSTLGSKNKRLRIESEESMELKLTWEEAQELLRPPPNVVPLIVVIDGQEIEEYEEAPVLGRPTIFSTNQSGGKDQWAQCEDCLKWRKLPVDALLPPRWTCSDNSWDPERSLCSVAQEITLEQLADLLPFNRVGHKKSKVKAENIIEGSDGLDTLANVAILGEGEPLNSSQPTTRHPRHRPGCTCIVCIQPPSGKGPKHKQSCTCNVCLTVKRRFRTLMLRKEKRQSEKEAETARKKQQQQHQQQVHSPDSQPPQEGHKPAIGKTFSSQSKKPPCLTDEVADEDSDKKKDILLSIKTEIDLNIQPEREEEPSPVADAGHAIMLLQSATS